MKKVGVIFKRLSVLWQKYITGSYDETLDWLSRAKAIGATHLVVVWDSFETEQFPRFIMPGDNPERVKIIYNQHPTTSVSKVLVVM